MNQSVRETAAHHRLLVLILFIMGFSLSTREVLAGEQEGYVLQFYNQQEQKRIDVETDETMIWLRAHGDYETDMGKLSYSFDGEHFEEIGGEIIMPYQLRTFQGVRYALFNFNTEGREG